MRHEGRVVALQILYQLDTAERFDDREDLVPRFFESFGATLEPAARRFAERLCREVLARRAEIDAMLEQASTHWRLERMSRVDRNILRLATAELATGETPDRVVLDEAVELAKQFGAAESAAFVNGVLNRVAGMSRGQP